MIMKDLSLERTRLKLQELQSDFLEDMEEKIQRVITDVIKEIGDSENDHKLFDDSKNCVDKMKPARDGALPDKEFLARSSLLTDLFAIKHIRTIYHIFVAILIILLLNTVIYDLADTGRPNFGFGLILWNFGEMKTVIWIWICMMAGTFSLYLFFHFFASNRHKVPEKNLEVWDKGWLAAFVLYLCVLLYWPLKSTLEHDLPPASSLIVLIEKIRLLMKSYAFVRSNTPKVLAYKPKDSNNDKEADSPCPGFSQFLYYIFVPTLVYRDSYPRTKMVRWRVVAWSFTEVVGIIFYVSFIFERLLKQQFENFGKSRVETKDLVVAIFNTMMPATLAMLCGFFCLLHSWLNAFAEMMCFADRMFYKDWWNSTSFSTYYRTWNVVVHDWLYTYIYKDFSEIVCPDDRITPKLMVFAVSAVFHEYILTFTFRYFYPVMLFMFGGAGVALTFVQRKGAGGNVFMWLSLCMGTGLFLSLYSMEWYARINCPQELSYWVDLVVPRSWTCNVGKRS
ncbi:sterol O-acyltransferase 1 isoform X2 [Neocloeon triangulifer]|nr:sterol O-acyltransferase 1 isoform X2 [Neocloeon triangulifer]XP_059470391.1 sterol O-acyltransferase 1 isoform X2 [Neocloeon triangulifer]